MKTAVRLLSLVSLSFLMACGGGGGASSGGASGGNGGFPSFDVSSQFIDAPVKGLQYYGSSYTSDGLASDDVRTTGDNGSFQCVSGETVTFSLNAVAGIDLGQVVCGASQVFPRDLNTVNNDARRGQMIALLLHHLADGFDGTNYINANSTIVISASAISFMANYDVNLNDDVGLMAIVNEVRGQLLPQRGVNVGQLSNQDFEDILVDAQTHLDASVTLYEVTNAAVPTAQELSDYVANHVSSVTRDTYDTNNALVLTQKCLTFNSGNDNDNAFSLQIGGTKYAYQDGINSFEVCSVTFSNSQLFNVGDLNNTIANFESTYSGKFFKKSNNDVRFANSCPSSNSVINGVCNESPINP